MTTRNQASEAGLRSAPHAAARSRLTRVIAGAWLPLADVLALTVAAVIAASAGVPEFGYGTAVLAGLAITGMYRHRITSRVSDQAARILSATSVAIPAVLLWLPASAVLRLAILTPCCLIVMRGGSYRALRSAHRHGSLTEPTILVGAGDLGVAVAELISEHPELGLRALAFLDSAQEARDLPLPVVGGVTDLPAVISRFAVRRVIVCWPDDPDNDLVPVLRACRRLAAHISVVPRLPELGMAIPRASVDELWGVPLIPLRRTSSAGLVLKRSVDALAAALLLCMFAPVLVALAVAIRLESGRPVLFRQLRVTGDNRSTQILKLRTLDVHSDSDTRWSVPTELTTRLGRVLRASHLDELPQLVNVLRGDMSLVGPRPERPYFIECFSPVISGYKDRGRMPAGMTGWAQVHGLHGDTSINDRVRFDNHYIENWSPWLDGVILLRTLASAVSAGLLGKS